MSWLDRVQAARKEGSFAKAMAVLEEELRARPEDPQVHYQIAWTHDALGKERDAVSAYERAIDLGLSGEDLQSAYVGLGSTLRCLGEYEKSLAVLDRGLGVFPDYRALRVFRALTLFNLGRAEESVGVLVRELAATSSDASIRDYQRALVFYSDKLSERFE